MQHPLGFVPQELRKRFFFTFLFLTIVLFTVFRVLDRPLQSPAAPHGMVSFELAGSPLQAQAITNEWKRSSLLLSAVPGQASPDIVNIPYVFAAFRLGFNYLFMPVYAFALAFGSLLATQRHAGWFRPFGAAAGYGAFAAAVFDAVENAALFQILLNRVYSPYPEIAYSCASIKFGLLGLGVAYALAAWWLPKG